MNVAARIDPIVSTRDANRAAAFLALLLACFYLVLLCGLDTGDYFLRDPDTYWHVAVGRQIWETAAFPRVDEFSFTFAGQPWIAKEWLSQLILFAAFSVGGWRGVVLVTAVTIAATYALLFLALGRRMRLTVAAGVATAAYMFSLGHFVARPQIFADPLLVVWVATLVNAVDDRTAPPSWLLPVMALWANVHASFTLGLALVGAFGAEAVHAAGRGHRLRTAARWALFMAGAVAFACCTPYGYRSMIVTYQLFGGNEAVKYVTEWQPVTLEAFGINELSIFALLFLSLYFGVRVGFWRLVTILAAAYLMFSHIRFASLFAILLPLLTLAPLTGQFSFLRLASQLRSEPAFIIALSRTSRALRYPVSLGLIGGLVLFGACGPAMAPKAKITPSGALDHIRARQLAGNMYNSYDFGGYLIFNGVKTFIDGRSDQLFQNGFMRRLYDVVERHPGDFGRLLDQYGITLALVTPDSPESQQLSRLFGWSRAYADDVSELYQRIPPRD